MRATAADGCIPLDVEPIRATDVDRAASGAVSTLKGRPPLHAPDEPVHCTARAQLTAALRSKADAVRLRVTTCGACRRELFDDRICAPATLRHAWGCSGKHDNLTCAIPSTAWNLM